MKDVMEMDARGVSDFFATTGTASTRRRSKCRCFRVDIYGHQPTCRKYPGDAAAFGRSSDSGASR